MHKTLHACSEARLIIPSCHPSKLGRAMDATHKLAVAAKHVHVLPQKHSHVTLPARVHIGVSTPGPGLKAAAVYEEHELV